MRRSTWPGSESAKSAPRTPPTAPSAPKRRASHGSPTPFRCSTCSGDDRGREHDEQRRGLGRLLREACHQRQERHHHDAAADAEQPGRPTRQEPEADEGCEENGAGHRTTRRIETAPRNRPNTSFNGRSSMRARKPAPTPGAHDRAGRERERVADPNLAGRAVGDHAREADRDDRAERQRVCVALAIAGPEDEQRDHDHAAADPEQSREEAAGAADRGQAPVEAAGPRQRARALPAHSSRVCGRSSRSIRSSVLDPFDDEAWIQSRLAAIHLRAASRTPLQSPTGGTPA